MARDQIALCPQGGDAIRIVFHLFSLDWKIQG